MVLQCSFNLHSPVMSVVKHLFMLFLLYYLFSKLTMAFLIFSWEVGILFDFYGLFLFQADYNIVSDRSCTYFSQFVIGLLSLLMIVFFIFLPCRYLIFVQKIIRNILLTFNEIGNTGIYSSCKEIQNLQLWLRSSLASTPNPVHIPPFQRLPLLIPECTRLQTFISAFPCICNSALKKINIALFYGFPSSSQMTEFLTICKAHLH